MQVTFPRKRALPGMPGDGSHDDDTQQPAELPVSQHQPSSRQPCAGHPLGVPADLLLRQVAGADRATAATRGRMIHVAIPVTRLAIAKRLVSAGGV